MRGARVTGSLILCAMVVSACVVHPPAFDPSRLETSQDGEAVTLTGWLHIGSREFQLYADPGRAAGPCVSGFLLSLAGVPTDDQNDRRMSVTGYLEPAGTEAAEGVSNPCGAPMVLMALEVAEP